MPAQRGKVIFRRWDEATGLTETTVEFSSLDDLFALCLQTEDALLVDRVIVEGEDAHGAARIVTLVFQSVTVSGEPDAS